MSTGAGVKRGTLKGHRGPQPWEGSELEELVLRALRQAADVDSAAQLHREALARAALSTVPRSAGAFSAFVLGPLHDTVREARGGEDAGRLMSILRPIIKKRSESEFGPMSEGRTPTVLVVGDDIAVRARLLSILNRAGYRAMSAPDSNVALAMSVRCRPDVIVSAADLGRARGSQLSALLNVAFRDGSPPLVLLGPPGAEVVRVPGVIVLDRPVDQKSLLQAVDLLIRRAAAQPDRRPERKGLR